MWSGIFGTGGTAVFVPDRSLPVRGRRGLFAGMIGTAAGGTAEGCGAGKGGELTTLMLRELVGGGGGSIVSPGDFRSRRGEVRGARGDSGDLAMRLKSGVARPLGCAATGAGAAEGEPGVADDDTAETGLVTAAFDPEAESGNGGTSVSIRSGTTVVVEPWDEVLDRNAGEGSGARLLERVGDDARGGGCVA